LSEAEILHIILVTIRFNWWLSSYCSWLIRY